MSSPSPLIAAAFSPDQFADLSRRWEAQLTEHLRRVTSGRELVQHRRSPVENIAAARRWMDEPTAGPPAARFEQLVSAMLARGQNLLHPHYIGHQVPGSSPIAALFDAVGSVTNQVMAVYEMGPWATAVERALVAQIGEHFGWRPDSFAGLITHGGSQANLTALLTARNVALPGSWEAGAARPGRPPVLIVQSDAHYCIARSAGILGLGTRQLVRVPLDTRRRMDPAALDQLLTNYRTLGQPVVAVCACAGATPTGAFDPLEAIAETCGRHRVWLHVDAAHGGGAIFSPQYRSLLTGIERADSVICDAHKLLFVPALCAFVLYRQREHRFETFQQDAPYLFDPTAPGDAAEFDTGLTTLECTKRAAGYGLWGLWSLFGPQLFTDLVERTFGLARWFWEQLVEAEDFVPLHEPQCNIVCFRFVPTNLRDAPTEVIGRFNREVRLRLVESGRFYIVQTNIDGSPALRLTVMNPLTDETVLSSLLDAIREIGAAIPAA
jgi:L-2,4-diaminobutyrate decarboxylase